MPFVCLGCCRPEELDVLATGTSELDFGELAKATRYDGGYHADHPTIKSFWEAVQEMQVQEQKKLLMFATGSTKVRGMRGLRGLRGRERGRGNGFLFWAYFCI